MNARATEVPYALRLRTKQLRDALVRIGKQERRSLNEIINQACEEFIERRTKP